MLWPLLSSQRLVPSSKVAKEQHIEEFYYIQLAHLQGHISRKATEEEKALERAYAACYGDHYYNQLTDEELAEVYREFGPLAYLADYEFRAISYPQRPSGGLSFPLRREPNASGMGVSGRGSLGSARSLHSRAAPTATNSADLAAQRSWAEPLVIFVVVFVAG